MLSLVGQQYNDKAKEWKIKKKICSTVSMLMDFSPCPLFLP